MFFSNLQLLDVTLRDGGYKTNFSFSPIFIQNILTALDDAGVQYVEVGYRNGSLKPLPNIGLTGICPADYLNECRNLLKQAKLTVIFHPKNVTKEDLKEMKECGVQAVRICFPFQNPQLGFETVHLATSFGFETFVNITRASQYTYDQLLPLIIELARFPIKAVYLADSNGSFTPEKIGLLFAYLKDNCKVELGFHAHDNLFLAQANAIAAITNGANYIDASLYGLGKGAGNLRTEGLISLLCREDCLKYDLCKALNAAEYASQTFPQNGLPIKDVLTGLFDLSLDDIPHLGEFRNTEDYYTKARAYAEKIQSSKEVVTA